MLLKETQVVMQYPADADGKVDTTKLPDVHFSATLVPHFPTEDKTLLAIALLGGDAKAKLEKTMAGYQLTVDIAPTGAPLTEEHLREAGAYGPNDMYHGNVTKEDLEAAKARLAEKADAPRATEGAPAPLPDHEPPAPETDQTAS